jgi:fibronectin-binding autotransporter adhesin
MSPIPCPSLIPNMKLKPSISTLASRMPGRLINPRFLRTFFGKSASAIILTAALGFLSSEAQAQQFWRTDGTSATWTGASWGTSGAGPFTTAWTSGSSVRFTQNSTATFATTTVGNVTVDAGKTVTVSQAGTLSTGSASARTFDIGTGATLTWITQNVSASANQAGFIKNGDGIWNIGAQGNAYNTSNSGFTLNAGTVIVSGNNSFGGANSLLTINGGTIQSSGTRGYTNNIVIGGNFTNSGTGNATFSGTVGLGSATRTINNDTASGSRVYSGVISGASGSGMTFTGTGAGQTYIGNAGNTYTGTISILGSEVGFASNGALGNTANTIAIDGGRLTSTSTAGSAVTSTWSSTHGIQVGDTAGTSISVQGGAGDLTYDGVISNVSGKTGSWAKQGSGILRLGGISTYTGTTAINNGILRLTTGSDRLPTGTVVSLGQAASANVGTFDLNGRNQTIAGLNSTTGTNASVSTNVVTSAAASTLTINASTSTTHVYSSGTAANSGVISGAVSFVKEGEGTQVLGGANSYTGTTGVNAGILLIEGSHTGGDSYTVDNNGAIGGNGSINSSLFIAAGGGFVFNPLSTLMVNGASVTFGGFSITDLIGLDGTVLADTYTLIDGTATIDFTNIANVGSDFAVAIGGGKSAYFESGSLNLVVIPEPSAALLGGLGMLVLLRRRHC